MSAVVPRLLIHRVNTFFGKSSLLCVPLGKNNGEDVGPYVDEFNINSNPSVKHPILCLARTIMFISQLQIR